MKKTILLPLLLIATHTRLAAQLPFNTTDSIDVNKICASVLVHGDMWWNPSTYEPRCIFPKHSGKSIGFVGGIWMSGYDGSGQLHITAQTYRQTGNDWWPGPLDASDTLTYPDSYKWAKIWKVSHADINNFLSTALHTASNTPAAILTWPAKGNADARGNASSPLTITTDMAPFIDLNGNGIYEPLMGEYPDIKGDQALWWIFSDNGPAHNETNGKALRVEVHAMAYAYSRGTLIDNVVYYDYNIINRSSADYSNFRFALRNDVDLGYYLDDYVGFDSVRRMGIAYNAMSSDGASAGFPANSYGRSVPVAGVTMVEMPGDAGTTYVPCGSFMFYQNDWSAKGNPVLAGHYDNYMRSKWRDSTHLKNNFAGVSTPSDGYGTGPDCNYIFPGDPSVSTEWSECTSSNIPGDRRYILSSNDFTFNAGSTKHVVFALVTTDPDTINACGTGVSFAGIRTVADTAWNNYYNPPPPLPAGVKTFSENTVQVFPNPANDKLFIKDASTHEHAFIAVYNTLGQAMDVIVEVDAKATVVDIHALAQGIYYVLYRNGNTQVSKTFIKE